MQGDKVEKTADHNNMKDAEKARRRRVSRMKTIIIAVIIILFILPTISCIFLGIQVSRLQTEVNVLLSLHSNDLSYEDFDRTENYAYAAEYPAPDISGKETGTSATVNSPDSGNNTSTDNSTSTDNTISTDNTTITGNAASTGSTLSSDNTSGTESTSSSGGTTGNVTVSPSEAASDITGIITQSDTTAGNNDNSKANDKAKTSNGKRNTDNKSKGIYAGKKVYLTFDDGPSAYTGDILDTLSKYHVKATFFVIGKTDQQSKKIYKRIVEEGHTLGMHSFSHKYSQIYNSVEDFDKDFTKLWELLYDTTGYKPAIYRFPGGSCNLVSKNGMDEFIRYLNKKSIVYFDWNVENGDATGTEYTKEQLIDNILDGVSLKDTSIVLMHDSETKGTTRDSLPELLKKLISGGAKILPLNKDVTPIQQIKSDSIK